MNWWFRGLGVVLFVIILLKLDLTELLDLYRLLDIEIISFTFLLVLLVIALKAWRWAYLLELQGIKLDYMTALLIYLDAIYVGIITPGRIGEAVKAIYLKESKQVSYHKGFVSIIYDRGWDLLSLFFCLWLGSILIAPVVSGLLAIGSSALMMPILAILLVPRLRRGFLKIVIRRTPFSAKLRLEDLVGEMSKIWSIKQLIPFGLSLLAYLLTFCIAYVLQAMLGYDLDFIFVAAIIALTNFFSLIPVTISGIGLREAALIWFLGYKAISAEKAVALSMLVFLTCYVVVWLLGAIAWQIKPITMLKKSAE